MARQPPRFLRPGDELESWIEGSAPSATGSSPPGTETGSSPASRTPPPGPPVVPAERQPRRGGWGTPRPACRLRRARQLHVRPGEGGIRSAWERAPTLTDRPRRVTTRSRSPRCACARQSDVHSRFPLHPLRAPAARCLRRGRVVVRRAGDELGRLRELVVRAQRGGVVLAGPSGVGKTRLGLECLRLAERAGLATVRVTATRSAAELPFGALTPLLPAEGPPGGNRGRPGRSAAQVRGGVGRASRGPSPRGAGRRCAPPRRLIGHARPPAGGRRLGGRGRDDHVGRADSGSHRRPVEGRAGGTPGHRRARG